MPHFDELVMFEEGLMGLSSLSQVLHAQKQRQMP
jgi:hypothetical protein